MQLEQLLLVATSSNPRTHFPIEDVCTAFGADAASLWLAGDLDFSELVLAAVFGRPDLEDQIHRAAFTVDNSFVYDFSRDPETPFFRMTTSDAALYHWDNDDLRIYTKLHYNHILVLNLFSKVHIIIGSLILYYRDSIPEIDDYELRIFANLMGRFTDTISIESRGMAEERRKVGHEIGRLINSCEQAVTIFASSKNIRQKKRGNLLSDIQESLSAARAASENETFIEGVLERRREARFVNLRHKFFSVSFAASERGSLITRHIFDAVQISSRIMVRVNEQDLDLLLSNLISNAAKYTIRESFIASTSQLGSTLRLRVSNPSERLPEPELERVWRFRSRGSNAGNKPGDGIGLTVVKDICRAYQIDNRFYQSDRKSQVWTHVALDFPVELWRWDS